MTTFGRYGQINFYFFLFVGLLAFSGCGENGEDNGDNGIENGIDADRAALCAQVIETRLGQVSGQLNDWSIADAVEMTATSGDQSLEADFAGRYRDDLSNHPGCMPRASYDGNSEPFMSDNQADVPGGSPASIPGYLCAAKDYDQPNEDTSKPILILVHGNSSGVPSFEEYHNSDVAGTQQASFQQFAFTVDTSVRPQLATRLLDEGYRVISFDARVDLVAELSDWDSDMQTGNPFLNIDHGWAVPMLQSLVKAVMTQNPDRKVSLIGHSLGGTVIRDALRRLFNDHIDTHSLNPFSSLQDVVLLSAANHGVAHGNYLCDSFPVHMKGTVACEMGDRDAFQQTYFTRPLNGPQDIFGAPCADGSFAFGHSDACDGNVVHYTTITMQDLEGGALQDEFVSEASTQIDLEHCVENELIGLDSFDSSGYFFTNAWGFLTNHFGTARSSAGINLILEKLAD